MKQGIHMINPDVDISCPIAMAKVNSQECVGKNNRETSGASTASTDAHGGTCTDA